MAMSTNIIAKAHVCTLPPRKGASQVTSNTGVNAQAEAVKLRCDTGESEAAALEALDEAVDDEWRLRF